MFIINRLSRLTLILFLMIATTFSAFSKGINRDSTSYFYLYSPEKMAEKIIELPQKYNYKDLTSFFYLYNSDHTNDTTWHNEYVFHKSNFIRKLFFGSKQIESDTLSKSFPFYTNFENKKTQNNQPQWIIGLFMLYLTMLAWVGFFNRKYIGNIFKSAFNYRFANSMQEESNMLTATTLSIINISSLLTFSLLIFETLNIQNINLGIPQPQLFSLIFLATSSVFAVKFISTKTLGYLFERPKLARKYQFNLNLYNQIGSFFGIIAALLLAYGDANYTQSVFYGITTILASLYAVRTFRLSQIIFKKDFSLLYLFLYLCVLEILPFLLILNQLTT